MINVKSGGIKKIIFLYYNSRSNRSINECEKWLSDNHLEFRSMKYTDLSPKDLTPILKLTEHGFQDIIIEGDKTKEILNKSSITDTISFSKLLPFLIQHPSILKSPIIFDECHLQIGYNKDDIRQFIPRERRRLSVKKIN